MSRQDSKFKGNIIIYLFMYSLFNKKFWSWAAVPVLLDSKIKWLAGPSLFLCLRTYGQIRKGC